MYGCVYMTLSSNSTHALDINPHFPKKITGKVAHLWLLDASSLYYRCLMCKKERRKILKSVKLDI